MEWVYICKRKTLQGEVFMKESCPLYQTQNGMMYQGSAEEILRSKWFKPLQNKINLIFTSPPFPLKKKKAYGNLNGKPYVDWLAGFAEIFNELLAKDGSLVIELGNSWMQGIPEMSTESLQALMELKKRGNYHLCQEFIWHNPSALPSPAEWVNIKRIRVKNTFSRIWWLSKSPYPKADNRSVLQEYSPAMKKLIENKKYDSGKRPSGYKIGEKSFLRDNKGAIPSNVLYISNTISTDPYLEYCKKNKMKCHPARMPIDLAKFFILFLTDEGDVVVDPFAGSNVTGWAAESLNRKWYSIEKDVVYARCSRSRFPNAVDLNECDNVGVRIDEGN
jgi:site-specific DNA-methyltransferase (cytosine-N4-specific)